MDNDKCLIDRKNIKIVFMGTPILAKVCLEYIHKAGFSIVACFTKPDTMSGRGMKLQYSEVKKYAMDNNIAVYQPEKIKNNQEVIDILKKINPDFIAVAAYGKILPKELLDIPKYGPINVHGSLLPKYRGAAPIQWAILNDDKTTGITTMFMDVGMDTGDMLLKEEVKIEDSDTFITLTEKLQIVGGKLLVKTLDKIVHNDILRIKQDDTFSVAPMITKDMLKIDFNLTAREIFNKVRCLMSTYIVHQDGRIFKLVQVRENNNKLGNVGEVVENKGRLVIRCKDISIEVETIKPQNSKAMDVKSFLNGSKINLGDIFI